MSTTTTTPLILAGDELEDARTLAARGLEEFAFIWRDCTRPDGGSCAGREQDLDADLAASVDLCANLGRPGYPEGPWYPLTRQMLDTLEHHARDQLSTVDVMTCETEAVVAFHAARAELAARVLVTVERLRGLLPPVPCCEACGQEVTA